MDAHCNSIYDDGEVAWVAMWRLHPQESCAVDRSNGADITQSHGRIFKSTRLSGKKQNRQIQKEV